ncbi:MAG: hypothetical protein VZQ83_01175 [Eubacterium sp.]|nr:hypothetical protein [Eubacterium sp.]
MNIIDKLERKFPRFGITNLMKYVIAVNIGGTILALIDYLGVLPVPIYANYLSLDFSKIFSGQVWRLVTFLLYPTIDRPVYGTSRMFVDLLWFAIWAYVYYSIGRVLEREWGKFRFTLFYFMGVFLVVVSSMIFYFVYGSATGVSAMSGGSEMIGYAIGMASSLNYLNETLFIAFALMFPDVRFFLYFLIPVKAKWLAYVYLGLLAWDIVRCIQNENFYVLMLILVALLNFAIFFIFARGTSSVSGAYQQRKRRKSYERRAQVGGAGHRARPTEGTPTGGARHKCAICGRTELDAPQLEFRFCSRCNGNYEYCSDHLFSHTHVQ